MNDYVKITDTEGNDHIVNKKLLSEIADSKDGCIIYVCGHPIKTSMKWNEALNCFNNSQTETNIDIFRRKEKSTGKTQ